MLSVPTEFWMLVRREVTQREFAEVLMEGPGTD